MEVNDNDVIVIENIKEIMFNYDCEDVVIPRRAIKSIDYVVNNERREFSLNKSVLSATIVLDKDYVLNICSDRDRKLLKGMNAWHFEMVTNSGETVSFDVPMYYKNEFLKDIYSNSDEDRNLFENHYVDGENYVVEFKPDKEKMNLSFLELIEVFKNPDIRSARTGKYLQVEILNRFYEKIDRENSVVFKILSGFCDYNKFIETFPRLKKGYHYSVSILNDRVVKFSAINHSYQTNAYFVFVKNINDVHYVNEIDLKPDSSHYKNGIIIIYENDKLLEEIKKKVRKESIYIDYETVNKYWIQIIGVWYVGCNVDES